ncbi:MAG: DDE-type integrase/transposase/recombinase [Saprospiraceae bacterium]|nr:DDE-type integrase/transposase/recombinase [Saprospiraceae bacterium]MBL0111607.1 DDE-type integrase/transposase/recombinase [Saprospiraceae bacterium]
MEKENLVRDYMGQGLLRDQCLEIVGLSKNQFYYQAKGTRPGKSPTLTTAWRNPETYIVHQVDNQEVVKKVVAIKLDPDHANWYQMITITLKIQGFYINHKKVYRLMFEHLLLEDEVKVRGKDYVKYRRVAPIRPLQIIEMDIKYVWVYEEKKYAFVLTIIDTFTRYVLHWSVGYSMKGEQIKQAWEFVVAEYFQPQKMALNELEVEVRTDNGKQFEAKIIREFFTENHINHVFTHPYTPEENGHVESFHSILAKAISKDKFNRISELETRLDRFYSCYVNDRSHSGTKGIPPAKYWALYDMGKIQVIPIQHNEIKVRLKVAYQEILSLPDIRKYQYRSNRA